MRSTVEPPAAIDTLLTELPIPAEQAFAWPIGSSRRLSRRLRDTRRQAQVVLDATDHERPRWVVVYYDTRDRSVNDIVVRIDARTGETRTEIRDDPACTPPVG